MHHSDKINTSSVDSQRRRRREIESRKDLPHALAHRTRRQLLAMRAKVSSAGVGDRGVVGRLVRSERAVGCCEGQGACGLPEDCLAAWDHVGLVRGGLVRGWLFRQVIGGGGKGRNDCGGWEVEWEDCMECCLPEQWCA